MRGRYRALPRFDIEGEPFYVDVEGNELCQVAVETNRISFRCMDNMGDHFLLRIDKTTMQLATEDTGLDKLLVVRVPPIHLLDPEGYARKNGLKKDVFLKKVDHSKKRML
jgi:hypothetical protein